MALWSWLEDNKEQVKIVLSIGTLILVGLGYAKARSEFRSRQTLSYIQSYQEDPVLAAKMKLNAFWFSAEGKALWETVTSDAGFPQAVARAVGEHELDSSVQVMLEFYRNLAACCDASVCDTESACSFFFRDMIQFHTMYKHYIQEWSKSWHEELAAGSLDFLETSCAEQWAEYHGGSAGSPGGG